MPATGTHTALSQMGAPVPPVGSAAHGYRPERTLRLRVELSRQLRRRRTQLTFGFLVVLPLLLALAFEFGGDPGDDAPGLVDLAAHGAANFAFFTLFAATGFLLVVVVALFAGDTVASEASWSSLRYLLVLPVPRARLLRQKLLVGLLTCAFALVLLPTVTYLVGGAFFGFGPVETPLGTGLSGSTSIARLALAVAYLAVSLLFVAALAFMIGVFTDAPLGAVGGAVMLVILSNILDAVTALGSVRSVLPTHYQFAWTDVLEPSVVWDDMVRGGVGSLAYSVVFLAVAFWRFRTKDIVS
jgi:ABC-2 type transport system permease protein